ncbi:MAG: AMP-binding protein [Deltaproteobacteria bacterium]|nr:AMP-binding protein [Deltaproteobacteria bacterium]
MSGPIGWQMLWPPLDFVQGGGAELLFQFNDSGSEALILQHCYSGLLRPILGQLQTVKHFICFDGQESGMLEYEQLIADASPLEPDLELNLDDLGELRYTSGTTGTPKGIMLPYRSWLAVSRILLLDQMPFLESRDRFLALQPLYHGAGWRILPIWIRGATHFVVPHFDPDVAFDLIEKEKITVIKTVPTLILRLLDSPDIKKRDLSSLRAIIFGASPMPVERLKQAIDVFGPVFIQGYGQTEAAVSICALKIEDYSYEEPMKRAKRLGSVGRPYTMVQVKVVNSEGQEVVPGELGELIVKGDHIMTGYLNRPEETAKTIRHGWVHTNDLATLDEDGYIYLTGGRKTEMIITGGLNVFPNEVEQVLYQHPAVAEAAVIGVPDPEWGEAIKACIVLKEGLQASAEELSNFCKERLSSYKKPRTIDFFTELPKNAAGKILHRELRRRYAEDQKQRENDG